jgi:hypothetical protein
MESRRLKIFLGSPSGLDDYRTAARACVEQVRKGLAVHQGIELELHDSDDVTPGFGRPQGVINPRLDECSVLIGILGNRLGTPTGEAESGFVEEYERMAARAEGGEDVRILIYAKRLGGAELDDPGEKLTRVLEFRERISGEVLFTEVRNADHFKAELLDDLMNLVVVLSAPASPGAGAAVPARSSGEETSRPAEPGGGGPAATQLRELFEAAMAEVPGMPERFRHEQFSLARMSLWLKSWQSWSFDDQLLGLHDVNQVYKGRAAAVLGSLERRQILRTACGQPDQTPSWGLLKEGEDPVVVDLISLAVGDREDTVRVGAIGAIETADLADWMARDDVDFDREGFFGRLPTVAEQASEEVRLAMIELALRFGGEEGRGFLAALCDRDISARSAFEGLIRWEAARGSAVAFELAAAADERLGSAAAEALRKAAPQAPVEALIGLARASTEDMRILAAEFLGARGEEGRAAIEELLADPNDGVLTAALEALASLPDAELALETAAGALGDRVRFHSQMRVILARRLPIGGLRDALDWTTVGSAGEYQVLTEDHFGEFGPQVRRDLADGFGAFAREGREKVLSGLSPQIREALEARLDKAEHSTFSKSPGAEEDSFQLVANHIEGGDWNRRSFTIAALRGLAVAGEASDIGLVWPSAVADDGEVREAAAAALARLGGTDDVPRLIELAKGRGGPAFARAALTLSPGPGGVWSELIADVSPGVALVAARHLYSSAAELSEDAVGVLLRHEQPGVRRVGVACLLRREGEDAEALEKALDRYMAAESYYYNVVCELDRALFAPPELRLRTREDLSAFADGTDRPVPGAVRDALRRGLLRARAS